MRHRDVLLPAALLCVGATVQSNERIVAADGLVAARIGEDAVTLRLDPGAPAMPMFDPATAERLNFKPGPIGIGHLIGSERAAGRSAMIRIDLADGAAIRRRAGWMKQPYAAGVDGVIGPGGLSEPLVRFMLRAPQSDERDLVLPLAKPGGIGGGWASTHAEIEVGGAPMQVRFDPRQPRSLATAGAAARLAEHHGGAMIGEAQSAVIAFGVSRPIRGMMLSRPLVLGSLKIAALTVRTRDFGSVGTIPEADAKADPDEVLVTGKRKRDPARDRLSLGADYLDRCSSITFDKPASQVRLRCN